MNLKSKLILLVNVIKMYTNLKKEDRIEDDYLTQSKARQEELRAFMVALDYDMDLNLVLENKGLAHCLSKLF